MLLHGPGSAVAQKQFLCREIQLSHLDVDDRFLTIEVGYEWLVFVTILMERTTSRQQHKVRVAGIDAPENAQPFGQRSKEYLSRLVFGTEVRVAWDKRDRYGRILWKVWVQPSDCLRCDQRSRLPPQRIR